MTARALVAEFVGTFCLVIAIVGTALFAAPSAGLIAVSLAAGLPADISIRPSPWDLWLQDDSPAETCPGTLLLRFSGP